jgi:hypothetical protein
MEDGSRESSTIFLYPPGVLTTKRKVKETMMFTLKSCFKMDIFKYA